MKLQPDFPLQTDPLPISQPNVSGSGAGTSGPQPNLGLFCVVTISQELFFFFFLFAREHSTSGNVCLSFA